MEEKERRDSNAITREYYDSILLETRYLDSVLPSTKLKLYGEVFQTPIMTAALSHLNNVCANGMAEMAYGAKEAGAVHWMGMGEENELEDVTATGARTVKIIKPHEDDAVIFHKIRHALCHDVFALGMDIDHAYSSQGSYDVVCGLPMRSKSLKQLKEYVNASKVPFIVKGVLSVSDAVKCVEAGVKGIVVSHHHGIMESSVPPLMVLPEIVKAVEGQMPVFVDCGIESGMDAFKAIALGATAVCVGRELMGSLKDGHDAVCKKIQSMTLELKSVMARTGASSLTDIDPSVVHFRNF